MRMMTRFKLLVSGVCTSISLLSQVSYNGVELIYPLGRTPVITGNYGEIRPNHFHAGIDFSTDPQKNLPIYSVTDGYVSRIKISPYGYGKVLYVTHPNGLVSVYAHQHHYAWKINQYVKTEQLKQQKNDIELFLTAGELPVKKGEVIGYSGNTGGSTGPHLHFELRNEKTEIPLNPLVIYRIGDTIKPRLTHLALYSFSDTMRVPAPRLIPLSKKNMRNDSLVVRGSYLGLGFAGYDLENNGTNPNNIYGAKVLLDNRLIYHHELNGIHFDEGRFVNAFSERLGNIKVQHCFTPVCYSIPIYKQVVNRGIISLPDTNWHTIQLLVYDETGNMSSYTYTIKSRMTSALRSFATKEYDDCRKDLNIRLDNFEISIPANSLYYPYYPKLMASKVAGGIQAGQKDVYMNRAANIKMKYTFASPVLASKYVLMVNGTSINTKAQDGWLNGESKYLGLFSYILDTIKPYIKPVLAKKQLVNLHKAKTIRFKISDALSGIANYHVYINDVWHIAEYDAKSDLLSCDFTNTTATGKVTIKVLVEDKTGNVGELIIRTIRE